MAPKPKQKKKIKVKRIKTKIRASSRLRAKRSHIKRHLAPQLSRHRANPIIEPRRDIAWESWQTFNPAAIFEDGKVHLLYRAIGEDGQSVVGYAMSRDGVTIHDRSDKPVFISRMPLEKTADVPYSSFPYTSGGGYGGCEDPRTVSIDGRIYMLYTTFDGWSPPRIALTSIDKQNFLEKKWNWKKPILLSPPGEIHKNWVLFPEKINGKFALLHSMSPEFLVDYFDNLDNLDEKGYIKSHYASGGRKDSWDTWVRGAGPPPIKTKYGWLLLYHAMDKSDPNRYKLGAMILDINDPTKILYRSPTPILEPDELYENEGYKAGVIYSCGAVVVDGTLLVYYGGADSVVCVASGNLEEFLNTLVHAKGPRLSRVKIQRYGNS